MINIYLCTRKSEFKKAKKMKKAVILTVGAALLLSSCGTYTGTGAYAGGSLGSILGSAIGGIAGGRHGSDIGTVIGMAGGAAVGAAVGAATDEKKAEQRERMHDRIMQRDQARQANHDYQYQGPVDSGFDETNSGDDRIYDFQGSDYTGDYSAQQPTTVMPGSSSVEELTTGYSFASNIDIRNARFVDDNQDNAISRGELCKVIFEVYNVGNSTLYDLQPTVVEATGNKHIYISPGMHVEQLGPGRGIRYTALVKADRYLKNGTAKICLSVVQGNRAISRISEFNIPTKK